MMITNSKIVETIVYAIKDINSGMEESGIKELEDLVVELKKKDDWRHNYDWKDPNDCPVKEQ